MAAQRVEVGPQRSAGGAATEVAAGFAAAVVLLFTACAGPARVELPAAPAAQRLAAVAGAATHVRALAFPTGPVAKNALDEVDAVVVGGQGWRLPELPRRAPALQLLRTFVERGGRVLLLGYAVALSKDLGVETRTPDVLTPFRWGFDDRAATGRAALGFDYVSGRDQELVDGMLALAGREHGFLLVRGAPLCAPLCAFATAPPERGEVLGRLLQQRDGATEPQAAAVLARWSLGQGDVLGLGLEPDLVAADAAAAKNAAAFTQQALQWLGRGAAPRRVDYWLLADPTPLPPPPRLPPAAEREVPGASVLAHWGIVAAVHDGEGPRTPQQVRDDVLLPAFAAGADVLALDLVDRTQGLPLPWGEHDPLARPTDYRGSAFARGWDGDEVPALVQEAHARGLLVQALLDPPPGGDSAAARLAALRFVARQWCDRRRADDQAIDGLALRQWFADARGLAVAMLQDFQPGGHVVRSGEQSPLLAGAAGALDARDGRPQGVTAFGLADGFRDGFPGDLTPVGYLDCGARRPLPRQGQGTGEALAGGTFGDWIAIQAADFARTRRGCGGAMLWDAQAPARLCADTMEYVHGVSNEPLVAAVAAACTSTGTDGWRDAQRALLGEAPPGFGSSQPANAATVMLTNNHLRLYGSGGAMVLDPGGLARFDGAPAVRLADSFFRTRFFGGRPDADELRTAQTDLLGGGQRSEGGYGPTFVGVAGGTVPRTLSFGAAPRWPQRVELPLPPEQGLFELRLQARALAGQGVLTVGLDGAVLAVLPFQDGRLAIARTLPLHLAHAGHRSLVLEVADGGALALDRVVVERAGDVAAEAEVAVPAGSLALVRERSSSTYCAETVELGAVADWPGIWLRSQCERAVRGIMQERRFQLLHHRTLRCTTGGDGPRELRHPFVLAADDPDLPDLAVVPLQLARYEHFRLDGGVLVLRNQPEAGTSTLVGMCLVPRAEAAAALPHLGTVIQSLERPPVLALGEGGLAELRSDLPIAWPRLLAFAAPARTPFLVRENGWWTWRGAQPRGDGSLLRVLQLPGDAVQIVGGQSLLVRTRPGPGALHTVALRLPTSNSVTARVLQASPLATPSVTMGDDFDEVLLDDKPWAFHHGRTVLLPNRAGTFRIATRKHGQDGVRPHVVASRAVFDHCAYDAATGELVLAVAAAADRPPELPFTAVLAGPKPRAVEGGQLVDESELRHLSAGDRADAERAGTVIRFQPGIVRVRYGK